ncbi:alpha/beta hydrolase [candidate division KSB3 bacterium]|uniref:Alpha/beta hydrolase n=1 Tax=candidate division KSB3 bacterium TaxID=2044937 RepID=A0A2G6E539_9BACT|nr:MAG: alpha/beta hydrolase [candidate division KSB3 bacterium]PIE29789.1 MAG: alpha/beta hydrolase [candidate division KSB3 bacterium]
MFTTVHNLKLHYTASGAGYDLLFLHGWGAQGSSFAPVQAHFEKHFHCCSLDLPGFGQSDPPPTVWGTVEYADIVRQFIQKLGLQHPILLGHSFGGRIAIRLASAASFPKVILVDSAGIRPKRSWGYYLNVYSYKGMKAVLSATPVMRTQVERILERFRQRSGSLDYQRASGIMRAILVKVVNEDDLRPLLPGITAPTLLVWGERDDTTPLADGRLMERLIPDAGLVVLKDAGHFSYLDRLHDFLVILDSFLQNERSIAS